jgi:hypothetical protein
MNACLPSEEFQVQLAEAPTTAQPGMAAPDQIFAAGSDQSAQVAPKGPVGNRPPSGVTPEAKDAARQSGLGDNHSARLKVASETAKFTEGQAAAQALLDITMAPATMAKFNAGAAAARAILKVAGSPDEAEKFNSGAAAARALLGKKPERPSANT